MRFFWLSTTYNSNDMMVYDRTIEDEGWSQWGLLSYIGGITCQPGHDSTDNTALTPDKKLSRTGSGARFSELSCSGISRELSGWVLSNVSEESDWLRNILTQTYGHWLAAHWHLLTSGCWDVCDWSARVTPGLLIGQCWHTEGPVTPGGLGSSDARSQAEGKRWHLWCSNDNKLPSRLHRRGVIIMS